MAERYRPRVGDAVWVEGRNPRWYSPLAQEDRYMNAEVIAVERDGAIVQMFDNGETEHIDSDFFTDKDHHPEDGGWGIWKIRY